MLYWYSLYPVHKVIFSDLINAVVRDAVYMDDRRSTAPAALP